MNECELQSISKNIYSFLLRDESLVDHREVKDVCATISKVYYAYRESLSYFETKLNFTVEIDGIMSKSLYDLIKHQEKSNATYSNLHVYKDGVIVGNITDGWCDFIPDHILKALTIIF